MDNSQKCRRNTIIETIGANIYKVPPAFRVCPYDWAVSVSGVISYPFKTKNEAEIWAMEQWILDITNCEVEFKDDLIQDATYRRNK